MTPGRIGRDPSADRLDHMPPIRSVEASAGCVDDTNNVLAFITPQAGVNLAPLVGQQVSVRGARGYMPEYKRPYLVAAEARTRIASLPGPTAGGLDRPQ